LSVSDIAYAQPFTEFGEGLFHALMIDNGLGDCFGIVRQRT
jgi:hypothetical protein